MRLSLKLPVARDSAAGLFRASAMRSGRTKMIVSKRPRFVQPGSSSRASKETPIDESPRNQLKNSNRF